MSIESKHAYRFIYLKSEQWEQVRLEALVREKACCEICGFESITNDAHHVWYPDNIYETTEAHLVILCRSCHDFLHLMLPECKTNDEDKGRAEWLKFKGAITAWRHRHNSLFRPKESPKELRSELERLKTLLAEKELNPSSPIVPTTLEGQISAVVMLVKKWGKAFQHSAPSVNSSVADSDYQI